MRFVALVAFSLSILAGCAGPADPVWAPDHAVQKYRHNPGGPAELRLYTVVSTRSGSGAHSSLLINGRERLLFDPAGSFQAPTTPERNDVLYGMTDRALAAYIGYHARPTFDVIEQRVTISANQADQLTRLVKAYGAVPQAQCALSISRILTQVSGFDMIRTGYFPNRLSRDFGRLPNVRLRKIGGKTQTAP